jgi:hypothetical protein
MPNKPKPIKLKPRKLGPRARANVRAIRAGAVLGVVQEVQVRFPKKRRGQPQSYVSQGVEVKLYFPCKGKQNQKVMRAFARRCGRYDLSWGLAVKPWL